MDELAQSASRRTDRIVFDDVSKTFGDEVALKGVSLSVDASEIVAIVGPNGSGKSTLAGILLGLQHPDSGRALIDGTPYTKLKQPMSMVGVALDGAVTTPSTTGRRHLRRICRLAKVNLSRADELLGEVGLEDAGKKRVGEYSLGMTKRLSLATALVGDPEILLLDEPFNGLDPLGVDWLQGVMLDHRASGGTVLVTSHRLADLEQVADRAVILSTEVLHVANLGASNNAEDLKDRFFAFVGGAA